MGKVLIPPRKQGLFRQSRGKTVHCAVRELRQEPPLEQLAQDQQPAVDPGNGKPVIEAGVAGVVKSSCVCKGFCFLPVLYEDCGRCKQERRRQCRNALYNGGTNHKKPLLCLLVLVMGNPLGVKGV